MPPFETLHKPLTTKTQLRVHLFDVAVGGGREVWVDQGLCGGDAVQRVVRQHAREQVLARGIERRGDDGPWLRSTGVACRRVGRGGRGAAETRARAPALIAVNDAQLTRGRKRGNLSKKSGNEVTPGQVFVAGVPNRWNIL